MDVRDSKGFTLVELLAAMSILGVLLMGVMMTSLNNLRSNRNMQLRYEAVQAAQTVIDDLRFNDISTLGTAIHRTVPIGARSYTVDVKFCEISAFCLSDEIRHISVEVEYDSKQIYKTDTVFTQFL